MKKRLLEQTGYIRNSVVSNPIPLVNTDSPGEIAEFLHNNIIGDGVGNIMRTSEKKALSQLVFVSPSPASRAPRSQGISDSFVLPTLIDEVPEPPKNVEVALYVQNDSDIEEARQLVVSEFNDRISSLEDVVRKTLEKITENQTQGMERENENKEREKLRAIYKSLFGFEASPSLDNTTLRDRINNQFTTNVTWLKTKINDDINQYFTFATPKIREILSILSKFPAEFLEKPDSYELDLIGRGERNINFKQVVFFIGYLAFLCILLFIGLIATIIKFFNYVDIIIGSTVEGLNEDRDVLEMRNKYREAVGVIGIGIIEYTMRCINIVTILKCMFSRCGILVTIGIMGIFIYLCRSSSSAFNWVYILIFKVLRIIVEYVPAGDTYSYFGKKSITVFIDSQITNVSNAVYNASPQVRAVQDTINFVTNTTGPILDNTKEFVNITMTAVPLITAGIINNVVNANLTEVSQVTQTAVNSVVSNAASIVSKVAEDNIVGVSNFFVDITASAIDTGLGGVFLGLSVMQDYAILFAATTIENGDDVGVVEDNVEVVETLREDVNDFQNTDEFKNERDIMLSIVLETLSAGDSLLHSSIGTDKIGKYSKHMYFIAEKMSAIPAIVPHNQLTINPRSLLTQTDTGLLENIERGYQSSPQISDSEQLLIKFKPMGTSIDNVYDEKSGQMIIPGNATQDVITGNATQDAVTILTKLEDIGINNNTYNSVILPLAKERYGNGYGELTKFSLEPIDNPNVMSMINITGSMVLKCILPPEDIDNIIVLQKAASRAINEVIDGSRFVIKKGLLYTIDRTGEVLAIGREGLSNKVREKANTIKESNAQTISNVLTRYEDLIKVSVIIVGGTAILYVAPAASGFISTLLPPLYTASVTGLQLVGSMGYYTGRAVGYAAYAGVNNVFYPTLRASVYMLSQLLGRNLIGNSYLINRDSVVVSNEFTKFIFGNAAMWLPLDQSMAPLMQTVSENYALVARAAYEIEDTLSPFVRHNMYALAKTIQENPNVVNAFGVTSVAIASSTAVGIAINDAKRSSVSSENFRGTRRRNLDKEILDTPQGTPRNSSIAEQYTDSLQSWYNTLPPAEQKSLLAEYENRTLTPGEKIVEDFNEDYRMYTVGRPNADGKIITEVDAELDRITTKLRYIKQIYDRRKKEEEDMQKNEQPKQPPIQQPSKSITDRFSDLFKGGYKKTRRRRVKKSTRKGNKKSGKKGKSNKKRHSNKKRKYSRR